VSLLFARLFKYHSSNCLTIAYTRTKQSYAASLCTFILPVMRGVIPKKMKITPLKEHPIQGTVTDITKQYVLRCDREKPSNNPPETEKEIGAVLDN